MSAPFPGEPSQVSSQGRAVQIWSGTGKAGTPVLLINQDQANTWTVNYRQNVNIGDSNAIPISPQSSYTIDGGRSIYAVSPVNTAPLLVIPGGGSFFQRITSLTIPTGATSGARIVLNGLLGVIEVFDAGNNLIASIAPFTGTDGSGNALEEGVTSYVNVFGSVIALQIGLANGFPAFFIANLTTPANEPPSFTANQVGPGGCTALMDSGMSTGGSAAAAVLATDSTGSGIPGGSVDIVAGQTTLNSSASTPTPYPQTQVLLGAAPGAYSQAYTTGIMQRINTIIGQLQAIGATLLSYKRERTGMEKCEKVNTYNTRPQAYFAMLKVPVKATGQVPFRVYYCPQHHGYHYTSKAIYKRKAPKNVRRA